MKIFLIAVMLATQPLSVCQIDGSEKQAERLNKLDLIIMMQDKRTINDGELISYFSDSDPIVRKRALLACGSIQDTNLIPLLVDRLTNDGDQGVSLTASFAIGQSAVLLSDESKRRLEHDLVWARMDQLPGKVRDQLIIDIGKFGTEQGLNDLILKFANDTIGVEPHLLVQSISRFAIRNITSPEAIQYLLQSIPSSEPVQREIAYCLGRIGGRKEVKDNLDQIVQLWKSPQAEVRMNIATLLGKVKDSLVATEILEKMLLYDPDWRVQVNAARALCNYDLRERPELLEIILSTFDSKKMNLAIAAINAFGNTPVKYDFDNPALQPIMNRLEEITLNHNGRFPWQLQGECANALAKLRKAKAAVLISTGEDLIPPLRLQMLMALGRTGAKPAAETLESLINEDNLKVARASLDGLSYLAKEDPSDTLLIAKTIDNCIKSLKYDDPAVVTSAAEILGDTLFMRRNSVEPLIECLENSTLPSDLEAIQAIIASLGKLRDKKSVKILQRQLESGDLSVIRAAASALKEITGMDYSPSIPSYVEPQFIDYDTAFLHSIKDTIRLVMETIRGDVTLELYKSIAPFTVMNFLKLATEKGFYRGLPFHRIVPNFVVQGGDPRGDGWGGPGYSIRSEFAPISFETGSIGMASSGKDTEGSQFFITQSPQPHLDGRYTNFGKVVQGIEVVGKLELDDTILDIKIKD